MNTENEKKEPNDEIVKRMPTSFQLMLEIEKKAQAKVAEILEKIDRGETTLDEIISQRSENAPTRHLSIR